MCFGKEKSAAARMLESNAALRNISAQSDLFDILVNGLTFPDKSPKVDRAVVLAMEDSIR